MRPLTYVRPPLPVGTGGSSSGSGAIYFCPKIYVWKINKMPEFYMTIARKMFSRFFWRGRARVPPAPPSPTPMVRGRLQLTKDLLLVSSSSRCQVTEVRISITVVSLRDGVLQPICVPHRVNYGFLNFNIKHFKINTNVLYT